LLLRKTQSRDAVPIRPGAVTAFAKPLFHHRNSCGSDRSRPRHEGQGAALASLDEAQRPADDERLPRFPPPRAP